MPKSSTNIRKHYRGDFDEDCEDLIKGPAIASIVVTVVVADHTYPGGSNAPETVNGSNIAEHVVGNLKAFKAWRRAAIKRLAQHNGIRDSSDKSSRYGSPVPREILDPDFDYKSEAAPELINAFLSQLDYSSNPFLPSPDELKQVGFEGTPYVYGVK